MPLVCVHPTRCPGRKGAGAELLFPPLSSWCPPTLTSQQFARPRCVRGRLGATPRGRSFAHCLHPLLPSHKRSLRGEIRNGTRRLLPTPQASAPQGPSPLKSASRGRLAQNRYVTSAHRASASSSHPDARTPGEVHTECPSLILTSRLGARPWTDRLSHPSTRQVILLSR